MHRETSTRALRYTVVYLRSVFGGLGDPQGRPYLAAAGGLVLLGSVFYAWSEGWTLLDAAYFCVITLATVGYGDFAPATPLGKAFTMLYIVAGLGILSLFIGAVTHVSPARRPASTRGAIPTERREPRATAVMVRQTQRAGATDSLQDAKTEHPETSCRR